MNNTQARVVVAQRRRGVIDVAQVHLWLDNISEWLIYAGLVFGPWAFGTTQVWSIRVMNYIGYALGVLLIFKWLIRWIGSYRPMRWIDSGARNYYKIINSSLFDVLLGTLTFLILAYCFVAALNARATYRPEAWSLDYHDAIMWLPHSYDSNSSWFAFWMYLGLAGLFWSVRDWLMTVSPGEEGLAYELTNRECASRALPPKRLRRLFFVLAINGALLAVEGIIQRADGTNKLLWMVEPRINNFALAQFGPYAYRSNAAQYFNLLWPAVLGFWWACARPLMRHRHLLGTVPRSSYHLLLPCVLLMGVCPVVSTSRGGAIIMWASAILAIVILLMARWRATWAAKWLVLIFLGVSLWCGLLLGWEELAPRLEMIEQSYEQREFMFKAGKMMAEDNPVFGTGPGTFNALFQFYRRHPNEYWPAQLHNDWLETRITFGLVGTILILSALLVVVARWFFARGIYGEKHFVMLMWVALAGCLVHARFDFPFQVHSIIALFLVLCAVLSCLSRLPEKK